MRTPEEHAVGPALIHLMRGVVYRESNEDAWATLERQGATVRDHFSVIGVELVVDDTEGYAYLRAAIDEAEELGFLRALRTQGGSSGQSDAAGRAGRPGQWEVRRIIKAYVDAQVLSDFAAKLEEYAHAASGGSDTD